MNIQVTANTSTTNVAISLKKEKKMRRHDGIWHLNISALITGPFIIVFLNYQTWIKEPTFDLEIKEPSM